MLQLHTAFSPHSSSAPGHGSEQLNRTELKDRWPDVEVECHGNVDRSLNWRVKVEIRTSRANGINNNKCTFFMVSSFDSFAVFRLFILRICNVRCVCVCGCGSVSCYVRNLAWDAIFSISLCFSSGFGFVYFPSLHLSFHFYSKSLHYVTFLFNVTAGTLAAATFFGDATIRQILFLWFCLFVLFPIQLQRNGSCFLHVEQFLRKPKTKKYIKKCLRWNIKCEIDKTECTY